MMDKTQNAGLKALIKLINAKEMDSMMVSFGMAPRINACGRMGNASAAVKLLLEEDENKAEQIALELDNLNQERKDVETIIYEQALEMIAKNNLDKFLDKHYPDEKIDKIYTNKILKVTNIP